MELFGLSAAKIITILIIAILILGPDKVPEMARTVGRTIRDVRRYLNTMTTEFNEATGGLREELTTITQDLKEELAATQADLRSQLDITDIFTAAVATVTDVPTPLPTATANDAVAATVSPVSDDAAAILAAPISNTPTDTRLPSETVRPVHDTTKYASRGPTKADPLADLRTIVESDSDNRAGRSRNGRDGTDYMQTVEAAGSNRYIDESLKKRSYIIGRSVTGSAYLRRHATLTAGRRGFCRSVRIYHRDMLRVFSSVSASESALIAVR